MQATHHMISLRRLSGMPGKGIRSRNGDRKCFGEEVDMPTGPDACEANRAAYISLLQGDELEEWRITATALRDGRQILPHYQGHFGAYAINLFILDQLGGSLPMHAVELGSGEMGCVISAQLADGRPLYIKLKIQDDIAVILSFHVSVHS
jgi:hypothetical protein